MKEKMKQNNFQTKGTRYRKVDLHIHTPASKCYKERGIKANAIVSAAIARSLEIIAVTDHNDISWVEAVQSAAKGKNIFIFPGIEITASGGHVLAIFDLNCPLSKLDDLLPKVGIDRGKRGKEDAIGHEFEKVVNEINNAGGLAIAAHANTKKIGILQHPQGQYKLNIYKKPNLYALELTDREDIEKFSKGKVTKYPPKPCIQGSDAHSLSEIGQRYTYLKMDTVSLEGIRQALLDYEIKIRFEWDNIGTTHPYIKRLTVNQGFFGEASFEFRPNLNCLIGGKNVGKSTVVEFLRYCFNDISHFKEIKEDTIGKVTKLIGLGGKISVEYIDEGGEGLIIERNIGELEMGWEEPPKMRTLSGEESVISSKPIFFSQGEIFRITSSPIAQLELIDRYIQIGEENDKERRLNDNLRTNAAKLIEAQNKYQNLMSEINNPETGKLVTKAQYEKLEKALKNPIFTEFPKWESEERFLKSIIIGIDNLKSEIQESLEQIDIDNLFSQTLSVTSPNYSLLKPLVEIREFIAQKIKFLSKGCEQMLEEKKKEIQTTILTQWRSLFSKKKEQHEQAIGSVGEEDVKRAQVKLRNVKRRADELEGKEKEANLWCNKIEQLKKERIKLLKLLKDVRKIRFEKRFAKAKEWEEAFEEHIKIEIIPGGDKQDYIKKLKVLLTGSYIYDRDIEKIAKTIDPEKLVEAAISNQPQLLATETGLNLELTRKAAEHLAKKDRSELYELEIVNLPDFPEIRFQVEPGKEKSLNELSVGTRSTIIVSLAMIEGKAPLIIDQPEDSLDTQFIFSQVAKRLRKEKDMRQFIFTTYNPNIVVSADAELTYVLTATAEKGQVKSAGGLDRLDTNKLVLLHLEGGEEAFRLRTQKYSKEEIYDK